MKREIFCPRCRCALEGVNRERLNLDYCSCCRGIWFDASELSQSLGKSFQFKKLSPFTKVIPSNISCPVCAANMTGLEINVHQSSVEIDLCRKCRGIWLDSGEYELIKKLIRSLDKNGSEDYLVNACLSMRTMEYSKPSAFRPRPVLEHKGSEYIRAAKTQAGLEENIERQLKDYCIYRPGKDRSVLDYYRDLNFEEANKAEKISKSIYFLCLFSFLPVEVFNPRKKFPLFLTGLIIFNIAVFSIFFYYILSNGLFERIVIIKAFGLCSDSILSFSDLQNLLLYSFLHSDLFHLLINMYMLWIFGDNVSDVFADHGRYKGEALFALFFFVTVIIGGLGHVAATFSNPITRFVPLVGASGGISAVMAAYWRLFPNTMFYQVFFFWPFKISVRFYMLFWMGVQFFLIYKYGTFSNVSWSCHLAGFLGGYFLLPLFLPFSLKEITSKAD